LIASLAGLRRLFTFVVALIVGDVVILRDAATLALLFLLSPAIRAAALLPGGGATARLAIARLTGRVLTLLTARLIRALLLRGGAFLVGLVLTALILILRTHLMCLFM